MQDGPHRRTRLLASPGPLCSPVGGVRMSSTADRRKAELRALLAKHDPDMLAFCDMARGVFPQARMVQLELPAAGVSLRSPATPGAHSPRWKDEAERPAAPQREAKR